MKVDRRVVIGLVVVVVLGAIAACVLNGPALWETILRMHGMR